MTKEKKEGIAFVLRCPATPEAKEAAEFIKASLDGIIKLFETVGCKLTPLEVLAMGLSLIAKDLEKTIEKYEERKGRFGA